ncbi:MAG: response regulator [Chloroflexota bacterium]
MILYIEDNAQNMRLVRKMLKVGGYEMIGAEDGTKGIEMAKSERPDLILVDINLPDIDGTEVTKRLKADSSFEGVPIIALTANAMYGDRERFLDAGCDDYLSKPVGKQELLDMVGKHFDIIEARKSGDDAQASEEDAPSVNVAS